MSDVTLSGEFTASSYTDALKQARSECQEFFGTDEYDLTISVAKLTHYTKGHTIGYKVLYVGTIPIWATHDNVI
jgi:hypothetical protein